MDINVQEEFRSYLDVFYIAIFRIRLLIEMSKRIGDRSAELKGQDLWGFLQNNLIVGAVVVEVFSLFDKKSNSMVKKFSRLLKLHGQRYVTSGDINAWISSIEKHEGYRHKILAHKEVNPPRVQEIMYADFLDLVNDFEGRLLRLESDHLGEFNSRRHTRITGELNLHAPAPVLDDLESILINDCYG